MAGLSRMGRTHVARLHKINSIGSRKTCYFLGGEIKIPRDPVLSNAVLLKLTVST